MTYASYIKTLNSHVTGFKITPEGPIAKIKGIWHSVNGVQGDIMDVRYSLTEKERIKYKVIND